MRAAPAQTVKAGLRKPVLGPVTNQPVSTSRETGDLDLSALLQEDSAGGSSIVVRSNLEKKDFKIPVTKLCILQDGSFICLLSQKLVRYSHEGQLLAEFEPPIPPRNFLVRRDGKEVVVIDGEGIKVYDENFLLRSQVSVYKQIHLAECVGLAEDQDGNLATINVNARWNGITVKGSSNIFIIDVVTGLLDRIIELKPLYEDMAAFCSKTPSSSTKSQCEFITVKNGVFYVVGLYRHLRKINRFLLNLYFTPQIVVSIVSMS